MDLPLEYCPLSGISPIRVGPCAVLGKQGLIALAIQAALLFNEIVPLLLAGIAKNLGGDTVPRLISTIVLYTSLHPYSVSSVPDQ